MLGNAPLNDRHKEGGECKALGDRQAWGAGVLNQLRLGDLLPESEQREASVLESLFPSRAVPLLRDSPELQAGNFLEQGWCLCQPWLFKWLQRVGSSVKGV